MAYYLKSVAKKNNLQNLQLAYVGQ